MNQIFGLTCSLFPPLSFFLTVFELMRKGWVENVLLSINDLMPPFTPPPLPPFSAPPSSPPSLQCFYFHYSELRLWLFHLRLQRFSSFSWGFTVSRVPMHEPDLLTVLKNVFFLNARPFVSIMKLHLENYCSSLKGGSGPVEQNFFWITSCSWWA